MELKNLIKKRIRIANWKKELIKIKPDDCKICLVDGDKVRNEFDIEFALGGHHFRYPFIPKDEIWLEQTSTSNDLSENALHEVIERIYMQKKIDYETAHSYASSVEHAIRVINNLKL